MQVAQWRDDSTCFFLSSLLRSDVRRLLVVFDPRQKNPSHVRRQKWIVFNDRVCVPRRAVPSHRSQADVEKLRLQELKNGRLAMLSVAACASEHWITGAVPFLTGGGY